MCLIFMVCVWYIVYTCLLYRVCVCGNEVDMEQMLLNRGRDNDTDGYEIHYNNKCRWKAYEDFKTKKRVLIRLCKCYKPSFWHKSPLLEDFSVMGCLNHRSMLCITTDLRPISTGYQNSTFMFTGSTKKIYFGYSKGMV